MLDQAFDVLKRYDWGQDRNQLNPIDDAVATTATDPAARAALETRLAEALQSEAPRDAKDYVCRKLMIVGTAPSVPTLAALLPQAELSHMARFALERIPAPEAAQALRDALSKVEGALQIGVIGSLGSRGNNDSVPALKDLLGAADGAVSRAAALALGAIGTAEAAQALAEGKPTTPEAFAAVTDSNLACAERLLAAGRKTEALTIYKSLVGENLPKHVRLAGTRGILACAQ